MNQRTLGIYEVLQQINDAPTRDEKVRVVLRNNTYALRTVLQGMFDPYVEFLLPLGAPPYKPSHGIDNNAALHNEARRLYLFTTQAPNLPAQKRENLFVQLLEYVHPKDAEILIAMKDKKNPYKGINAKLVHDIFPDITITKKKDADVPVS